MFDFFGGVGVGGVSRVRLVIESIGPVQMSMEMDSRKACGL